MVGLTTRPAPPDVLPAMIRSAEPLLWAQPVMAGFGPMYVASMAPENSASIADGPALNVLVSRAMSPSSSAKILFWTPTRAGAWVMLAK
jgi:hypothetical protein